MLSETLAAMENLLRKYQCYGQANIVGDALNLAKVEDPELKGHLISTSFWGGAGAVWEVSPPFEPDDRRAFWQLVVNLADEMGNEGWATTRVREIAAVVSMWLRDGY
jgi:hypothetical protein